MTDIGSTFRTDEPHLHELLAEVHKGHIQLPDFQRGWVWDDEHIRALIASVSLSYPIGAVMLLETGGEGIRFKPRPFEGVEPSGLVAPSKLALDGQQRLTSLYMSLRSGKPVPTRTEKGKDIQRVYYLDMRACLEPEIDRVDAVRSFSPDRVLRSDFGRQIDLDISSADKEYEAGLFPLDILFEPTRAAPWKRGYRKFHDNSDEKMDLLERFEEQIVMRFQTYKIPVIVLRRETPKEAVCQVFEKVNTGGVSLTVFELVTATFAADDFPLRRDWDERAERIKDKRPVLHDVGGTDFLTAVTLCSTYRRHMGGKGAVGCKRKDILKLTLDDYKSHADAVEQGFGRAARFLSREHVYDTKGLPYHTQLLPLSVICAALGDEFERDPVRQKLARWYWSGVFGELYGSASEARYSFDVSEVLAWIRADGGEPRTIQQSNFAPVRLLSLQNRLSAAYKGLMARLIDAGSHDFMSGDAIALTSYFELDIDIHHIFPRAYCEKSGLDRSRWNSVVNKAPLSARTNRIIGGHKPSTYLSTIEKSHGVEAERLDAILGTHLIDPLILRNDAFDAFIRDRAVKLLDLIERTTGKQVTGRDSDETIAAFGSALLAGADPDQAVPLA
jgi:hypothetical protein